MHQNFWVLMKKEINFVEKQENFKTIEIRLNKRDDWPDLCLEHFVTYFMWGDVMGFK